MDNKTQSGLVQQAVQLVKSGKKQAAAGLLAKIIRANPDNEEAWLWLAAAVSDPKKQSDCLQQALRINPANAYTRRALGMVQHRTQTANIAGERSIPVTRGAAAYDRTDGARVYVQGTRSSSYTLPAVKPAPSPYSTADTQPIFHTIPRPRRMPGRLLTFSAALFLVALLGLILYFFTVRPGNESEKLAVNRILPAGLQIPPGEDLAAVLANASPGETIYLSAGTYTLERTLEITQPVELSGAGMGLTRIVTTTANLAIRYSGDGHFTLAGVEIVYQGSGPADLVRIENGQFSIRDSRFAGAIYSTRTRSGGRGVILAGSAAGEISQSEALDNGYAGFEVRDVAQVTLLKNVIHDNGGDGILIAGQSSAVIEENILTANGRSGITYLENSSGKAAGNEIEQNEDSGIYVSGQAAPVVYANRSNSNYQFGIRVSEEGKPVLLNNSTLRNAKAGIAYFDHAAGAAEENECSENELHGISVNGEAAPFLRANRCNRNRQVGFDYWGKSGGTATNNDCSQNGLQGIAIHESASPTIENNTCKNNQDSGIIYWGSAGGTARNNDCSGNKIHGISVHDKSNPVLILNSCLNNIGHGIAFHEASEGEVRDNTCTGNSRNSILVQDQAKPLLAQNRCKDP